MAHTAILLGATGLVGSRCVHHLVSSDVYQAITCLVRRPLAHGVQAPKLVEKIVDFEALVDADLPHDCTDLYCALGTTIKKAGSQEAFRRVDFDLPLRVAKLLIPHGLRRIALVSSVGADARSGNFYLRTKGELEDELEVLAKRSSMSLHIVRPSFLMGDRSEERRWEAAGIAVARATSGLLVSGLRKYRPISADVVAKAMVAAMTTLSSGTRQVYEFDAIRELSSALEAS